MYKNPNDPHGIDSNRLMMAVVVSLVILLGFYYFVDKPKADALNAQKILEAQEKEGAIISDVAGLDIAKIEDVKRQSRDEVYEASKTARVAINAPRLHGSISLLGGRLDDVQLKGYMTEVGGDEIISLFSPKGTEQPYYAEFGWMSTFSDMKTPTDKTLWKLNAASPTVLTETTPVTLSWDNGQGQIFERTIAVDENYMFKITQRVINTNDKNLSLRPYQLISRHGMPKDYQGFLIVHEGPLGWMTDELYEIDYDDLEDGETQEANSQGGWIGFTDKYWFTALISSADHEIKSRFIYTGDQKKHRYQTDTLGKEHAISANETVEYVTHLFVGAKEIAVLNAYKKDLGAENLDLAIDFGMWWFLTKPLFLLLNFLSHYFNSLAIGILLLTVILRFSMFPLTNKSFRSMGAMKKLSPKLKEIQEEHKGDREKLQGKIMELYQKEGVTPFSGCWPILLQIPIFFSLYKVILIDIDMRHAPFWGWVSDMSVKDPTSIFNLFGVFSWELPSYLMIGAWPCIMGLTMAIQRRLNPPPADPTQAKVAAYMPYFFTILLAKFAAGLVIYWSWSNLLAFLQQYFIMRRMGVDVSLIHGHGELREAKEKKKKEKKNKKEKSNSSKSEQDDSNQDDSSDDAKKDKK